MRRNFILLAAASLLLGIVAIGCTSEKDTTTTSDQGLRSTDMDSGSGSTVSGQSSSSGYSGTTGGVAGSTSTAGSTSAGTGTTGAGNPAGTTGAGTTGQ